VSGCALRPALEQMATRPTAQSELVTSLFVSVGPSLFRYVARATGSLELADDIVQDAFLVLYRKLCLGERIKNPSAYVFGVARNQVRKHARSQRQRGEVLVARDILDETCAAADRPVDTLADLDEVTAVFSVLTEREEAVVLLRLQSLKYREIAEQLGISPKTVATLLARAISKLQKAIKARRQGRRPVPIKVMKRVPETLQ